MAGFIEEEFVELPLEDIKHSCGFGLDIGGTIAKLAYRSKEDFKNGEPIKEPTKKGFGCIRLKGFPRNNVNDLLDFMQDNCDITKNKDGVVDIHCTGIGGHEFLKNIQERFNGKIKNETEFDLFVKTFCKFAATKEKSDFVLQPSEKAIELANKESEQFKGFKEGIEKHSSGTLGFNEKKEDKEKTSSDETDDENKDKMLPCLMVMCGSAGGFLKVDENEKFGMVDGFGGCGRTFLGLSNLLTGIKDFDKLMEMAASGDGDTTDVYGRHLKLSGDEDMYSLFSDNMMIYPFGQAAIKDRDTCKKEDIIFSLLAFLIMELVHTVTLNMKLHGIKKAFFCGNFVNHEIMRNQISTVFTVRTSFADDALEFGFLKQGGFLGAIGAYLIGNTTSTKKEE